jgi:hypothetical protein
MVCYVLATSTAFLPFLLQPLSVIKMETAINVAVAGVITLTFASGNGVLISVLEKMSMVTSQAFYFDCYRHRDGCKCE